MARDGNLAARRYDPGRWPRGRAIRRSLVRLLPSDRLQHRRREELYRSLGDGIRATIDTLMLGSPTYGYGPVLASLAACAPAESTAAAINASAWCRGCAGGLYVLNVVPLVRADHERFAAR